MFLADHKVKVVSIGKCVEDILVVFGLDAVLAYSVTSIMLQLFLFTLSKKTMLL